MSLREPRHPLEMTNRDVLAGLFSGPMVDHETEYYWNLDNWSDLHETVSKNRIYSEEFVLEGTNGAHTCKLLLEPTKNDRLTIIFSSLAAIFGLRASLSAPGLFYYEQTHTMPFTTTSFAFYRHKVFDKNNRSIIFNNRKSHANALTIVVKISLTISKSLFATFGAQVIYPSEQKLINKRVNIEVPQIDLLFRRLLVRRAYFDVTFVVGEKEFPFSKGILANHSTVFKKMFSTAIENKQATSRIIISDTKPEVFEKFLGFLFRADVTGFDRIADALIILADRYKIEALKKICELRRRRPARLRPTDYEGSYHYA